MNSVEIAESVRTACLAAAAAAYEDAGLQGLCADGRWEAAMGAIEKLDLSALLMETTAERDSRRVDGLSSRSSRSADLPHAER